MRPFDQRVTTIVAACGVFVISFLFRFLYPAVDNDFFLHVVRGRQMLLRDPPRSGDTLQTMRQLR